MKSLIVLLISGLISATASASNWVLIGEIESAIFYVDTESIANTNDYKTAFVRVVERQRVMLSNSKKYYNSSVLLKKYDCKSIPRKNKMLAATAYNNDEVVLSYNSNSDWRFVYPDSIGKTETDFVCSYRLWYSGINRVN